MKKTSQIWGFTALIGLAGQMAAPAAEVFVFQNKYELTVSGDFDGDGRLDMALVDRASGKYRLAYQLSAGVFTWSSVRVSGIPNLTGVSVGRAFDAGKDALAFTSADGSSVHVIDAASPGMAGQTVAITPECLGPSTAVLLDIGGAGNTPAPDLYIGSIYNADPANLATLFRNEGGKFKQIAEGEGPGPLTFAQRLSLKAGGTEYLCAVIAAKDKSSFVAVDLANGKVEKVAQADGLPPNAGYVAGQFRGQALKDLLFYQPEEKKLVYRPVEETGGKLQLGNGAAFELPKPVFQLAVAGKYLVAVHGTNDPAAVYSFDGTKAPTLAQTLPLKEGEMVSAVAVAGNYLGVLTRSSRTRFKYATHFEIYALKEGQYASVAAGELPTMELGDAFMVPDIHRRIVENLKVKTEAEMQVYTNTLPGSSVTYVMVPIKGGEFTMGSPDTEKNHKPDESPQHKVKVDPFWMGMFEVTWNEYEIFMYPDDEKKLRETYPTDEKINKISDAVTRPSKPYVEMSFGMGKDGYPAIAMTQHGGNKYCMWLSAKTGEFYRLPTEAEWEYACRAGTTTAYSFGDDESQLGDYAWYEQNSDFKYQKVGTKKPNPWGLFDMHGNVAEWCLDQYEPNYEPFAKGAVNPWVRATKPYPHSARGGSWDHPAEVLRSAARIASTPDWKAQDPQLPKSVWYLTDAQFIGFRLVRPLKVPPPEEMAKCWISGVEKD